MAASNWERGLPPRASSHFTRTSSRRNIQASASERRVRMTLIVVLDPTPQARQDRACIRPRVHRHVVALELVDDASCFFDPVHRRALHRRCQGREPESFRERPCVEPYPTAPRHRPQGGSFDHQTSRKVRFHPIAWRTHLVPAKRAGAVFRMFSTNSAFKRCALICQVRSVRANPHEFAQKRQSLRDNCRGRIMVIGAVSLDPRL